MSNLFRQYISTKPVRVPLDFGHNENIIISKISTEERKSKDVVLNVNTFITLSKVEPDTRKSVAAFESNFWNLDPTKDDIVRQINDQFTIMAGMIMAVGGDAEKFDEDSLDVPGFEEDMTLADFVKNKTNAKKVQDSLQEAFLEQMKDKIGDNCPLLKCKLVSNKKGFLNFSREINWIVPMEDADSIAKVTDTEKKVYEESQKDTSDKQEKPDETGEKPDAPAEKTTGKSAFSSL